MSILTLSKLRSLGVCREQVDEFAARFGEFVDITPDLCESVANIFDWSWASRNLLRASARAEYDRVRDAARTEYDRALAPARAKYDRVRVPALAEYDRVCTAARAEYDRVRAPARAEYDRVCARTFGQLYQAIP